MKKLLAAAFLLTFALSALAGKNIVEFYPGVEGYVSSPDITWSFNKYDDKGDGAWVDIYFWGTTAKDTITFTKLAFDEPGYCQSILVAGDLKTIAYKGGDQGYVDYVYVESGALAVKMKKVTIGRLAAYGLKSVQVRDVMSVIQHGDGNPKGAVVKASNFLGAGASSLWDPYFTGCFKSIVAGSIGKVTGYCHAVSMYCFGNPVTTPKRLLLKCVEPAFVGAGVGLAPGTPYKSKNVPVYYLEEPVPGDYLKLDLDTGEVMNGVQAPEEWTLEDKTRYMWFNVVGSGSYTAGSADDEPGRQDDECSREVYVNHPCFVAVFELTEGQYARIMGSGDKDSPLPRCGLSYDELRGGLKGELFPLSTGVEATSIVGRLRQLAPPLFFDIPTEAEWERVCKNGTVGTWNDGSSISGSDTDENLDMLAWYAGNSDGKPHEVGLKRPNGLGLYDMHGNVAEWCRDWYDPETSALIDDPLGSPDGTERAARGGSYAKDAPYCRSACRFAEHPDKEPEDFGARLFIYDKSDVDTEYMKVDLLTGDVETGLEYADISSYTDLSRYLWLRKLRPGYCYMGSQDTEPGRVESGEGEHLVQLTRPFYASISELTEGQYAFINGFYENFSALPKAKLSYDVLRGTDKGAQFPASTEVDADSVIGKLRDLTGLDFDLPTEAQWEFACRAGSRGSWNDGQAIVDKDNDDNLNKLGWYSGNSGVSAHEVGQKRPNAWGLYDMHGNVYEWCLDWYQEDITELEVDPVGPESGTARMIKGGHYNASAAECRAARRNCNLPERGADSAFYGVRIFLSL